MDFGDLDMARPRTMLMMDPPDHTRLRKLVSKAFTPRTVERLRPHVADLVTSMLDEVDPSGFDLISVGYPLPVTVICELLGVPAEDRHPRPVELRRRACSTPTSTRRPSSGASSPSCRWSTTSTGSSRRGAPRVTISSPRSSPPRRRAIASPTKSLRATVVLLFVAGHETTMNLIGNGTVALLRQRDQWDRLVEDPSLAPGAVEESLRFDGRARHPRAPRRPTRRRRAARREGPGPGHARRRQPRPERFPDPDRIDITRPDNHHLTFSHGIHYCLGALWAARGPRGVQGAQPALPDARLDRGARHREHFVLRGYKPSTSPVEVRRAGPSGSAMIWR